MKTNLYSNKTLNKLIDDRNEVSEKLQRLLKEYDEKIKDCYNQICHAEDILGKLICYSIYISHKDSSMLSVNESWYSWLLKNNNDPQKAVKALFDHKNNNFIKLKFNVPTSTKFLEYNQCFEYKGKCFDITLTLDETSKEYYCSNLHFSETYSKNIYYTDENNNRLDYYFNSNNDIYVLVNGLLEELNEDCNGMICNLINRLYTK